MSSRKCMDCGESLVGRIDKKFCDDSCRSNFHNQRYSQRSSRYRPIEAVLRKNRAILEQFLDQGVQNPSKKMLDKAGFRFDYFTQFAAEDPEIYVVYDFGLQKNTEEEFQVLKLSS